MSNHHTKILPSAESIRERAHDSEEDDATEWVPLAGRGGFEGSAPPFPREVRVSPALYYSSGL